MTNQALLISYLNKLAEEEIFFLLDAVTLMPKVKDPAAKPPCLYYGSGRVVCYGHACRKQRFPRSRSENIDNNSKGINFDVGNP